MKHFQLEILVSLAPIHKKISRSLACKANMFMLDAHMNQRPPLMALLLRIPLGLDAYRDIGQCGLGTSAHAGVVCFIFFPSLDLLS